MTSPWGVAPLRYANGPQPVVEQALDNPGYAPGV